MYQWAGPKTVNNSNVWFGMNKDASMTSSSIQPGIISTSCSSNGTCVLEPFQLVEDWIRLFLLKDASADLTNLTHEVLDRLTHLSSQMYDSTIGTNDPDLSAFRNRGGKLVGYHGTVSEHPSRPSFPLLYKYADSSPGRQYYPDQGQPALLRRCRGLGLECARLLSTLPLTGPGPLLWR